MGNGLVVEEKLEDGRWGLDIDEELECGRWKVKLGFWREVEVVY